MAVKCPECGKEAKKGEKKCLTCGFKLGVEVEEDVDEPEDYEGF